MRVRVLGSGVYGSHIALALIADGHDVIVHEVADRVFAGASGACPARTHCGAHYPRSYVTRAACREHSAEFMARYAELTRPVPINLYAIADDSLVDFQNYTQTLRGEIEFITVRDPAEFGLRNCEGAILVNERHLCVRLAREYFTAALGDRISFGMGPGEVDDPAWELTIDSTFCANDEERIDRFEPCLTVLVSGPIDRSTTIMDGMFPSLYVWDEEEGLSSLTSAKYTPFSKTCRTWRGARELLDGLSVAEVEGRAKEMLDQMAYFWPEVVDRYQIADHMLSIRAMPKSTSDARLVDVVRVGRQAIRVRAGKIDGIIAAEKRIKDMIREMGG